MKTASQVQTDIINLLKGSQLVQAISGKVYRNGYRPRNSKLEDLIVTFTTGQVDQIETGIVTLNIYVPDIPIESTAVMAENGRRTSQLEDLSAKWVKGLTIGRSNGYKFELRQTIFTEEDPDIHQHFIVIKLSYKYF